MGGSCTKRPIVLEDDNKDNKLHKVEHSNQPKLTKIQTNFKTNEMTIKHSLINQGVGIDNDNKNLFPQSITDNINLIHNNLTNFTQINTLQIYNSQPLNNYDMRLSNPTILHNNNLTHYNEPNSPNSPHFYNINQNQEFIKGQCIGTGKLGSVYSGLSLNTGEIVAIKSIKLNDSNCVQKQIYDINEAVEKIGQLKHKNIIKYICTQPGENVNEIEIIFEYCNGGSIKQLLEKFDKFDEKLIRLYVKQILEGLVYLHEQGIVHRNIKNCNILVDGNGCVKLSDFVVSNILIGDDAGAILYFNTNNGIDPPYWMAPEIVNKEPNLTSAVDIWSLGCIIIEMATRKPPWSNVSSNCQEIIDLISSSQGII